MKILLIAPHFSPDEHIGASRWNRLSKYLLRDGHEVHVIASNIISDTIISTRSTKLFRVDYRNSRLDRFLSYLREIKKSWPAEQRRQDGSLNNEITSSGTYSKFINFIGKYLRFPGIYWWSTKELIEKGVEIVNSEQIDVIIATFPFSVSISSAHNISKKTNTPWIADMRDGWSSYYFGEYKKGSFLFKMLQQVERYYLSSALSVVTISDTLAGSICVDEEKIVIIPNVFDPEEQKIVSTPFSANDNISFSFAGSVHDKHCWEIFFQSEHSYHFLVEEYPLVALVPLMWSQHRTLRLTSPAQDHELFLFYQPFKPLSPVLSPDCFSKILALKPDRP